MLSCTTGDTDVSWLEALNTKRAPALFGIRVLKDTAAPYAAPVSNSKPDIDTHKMCVTAVLTTRTADRQGDIVDPTGGDFSEHSTNPVVMFHHGKDHKLPIGKAEDPDGNYTVRLVKAADGDLLLGTTYFAQSNKFAQDVFGLIAEDVLRGVSIGFDPLSDGDAVEEIGPSPVLERPALHFKGWKLLEYSHTPIGVNRDALTVAVQKSLDGTRKLHPALEKALTPLAKPRNAMVTGGAAVEKGRPDLVSPVPKMKPKPLWSKGSPNPTVAAELKKKLNPAAKIAPGTKPKPTTPGLAIEDKGLDAAPAGVTKAMPADPEDDYADDDADAATATAGQGDQDDADDAAFPGGYEQDDDPGAGAADQYDPASDDPDDDPNLPEVNQVASDDPADTPPTVQALLDAGQGMLDLCGMIQESLKRSEHLKGRKFGAKLCADLKQTAGECSNFANKIRAELSGNPAGGPGDTDDNADEDSGEPVEPPETDDDGAMITKGGYVPRRFTYAELAQVAPAAAQPKELKALQRELATLRGENEQLKETLNNVLDDLEASNRRRR